MTRARHDIRLDSDAAAGATGSPDSIPLTDDLRLTTNSPSIDDRRWKRLFGFVTARPHEYLIHIRSGQLLELSSGQSSRCFKWPGDTVVLIPTTLKQLVFETGQVTLDNVHVRIRGFAIYRITDPLKTYKLISFWDRWEGEKKLARIIGEPCRSHTKWLVSNMTMEECIRKRKESIADILLKELRLTITEHDTGVSIETVDIQDVRFGDDELFEAFQGPSKQDIHLKNDKSGLDRRRETDLTKLKQEEEIAAQKLAVELARVENAEAVRVRKLNYERAELEEQRKRKQEEAEHTEILATMRDEKRLAREQRNAEVKHQITVEEIKLATQKADANLAKLRERVAIENQLQPVAIEKAFIEKALPEVASAIAKSLSDARFTIYQNQSDGGGGSPFSLVVNEIMSILRDRVSKLAGSDAPESNGKPAEHEAGSESW